MGLARLPGRDLMMDPVYIEWLDHASTQGWVHPCDLDNEDGEAVLAPVKNYTFGFIVYETKQAVYISHTWTYHGYCCDPIVILKSLILKRKKVKGK